MRTLPARPAAIGCALVVIGLGVVLTTLGLWRGGGTGLTLVYPGGRDAFSMTQLWKGDPRPWSMGGVPMCLDRPGSVVITRLTPRGGNAGLRITAFATRPEPRLDPHLSKEQRGFLAWQRPLSQAGFSVGAPAVVAAKCSGRPDDPSAVTSFYELAATFARTGNGPGWFSSVDVAYRGDDGETGTVNVPWGVKICGPEGRTEATCPIPPPPP